MTDITTTTTTTTESISLTDLAVRIRAEHEAVCHFGRQTLQHALRAGDLLLEAKKLVEYGSWSDWLRHNCDASERSAQAYMQLANNRAMVEAKAQATADLTIEGALSALAAPKTATTGDKTSTTRTKSKDRKPATKPPRRPPSSSSRRPTETKQLDEHEAQARVTQDIGEQSNGENARLHARIEELENQKRRVEFENVGLTERSVRERYLDWLQQLPKAERIDEIRKIIAEPDLFEHDMPDIPAFLLRRAAS